MVNEKERNISLDFLRVISMFMIVVLHCLGKGNALNLNNEFLKFISWTIEAFCICSTNVFVLISGYFLVDSKFKLKKILLLWGKVLFYSIVFLIIFKLKDGNISSKELIFSIFPILTKNNYWFITIYIFLYILSPYINVMIKNLDKKQHLTLCSFLIVFFCIISLFLPYESLMDNSCGTGIIWFITLYIVAAYIKKYVKEVKVGNKKFLILYIISSLITVLAIYGIQYVGKFVGFENIFFTRIYMYNTIFVFSSSIFLFMYFKNMKINNKIVTKFTKFCTPLTFGIYLIHENIFVIKILYKNVFNFANYGSYPFPIYILIIFLSAFVIFSVCVLIDYLRTLLTRLIIKNSLFNQIKLKTINIFSKIQNHVDYLYSKIL